MTRYRKKPVEVEAWKYGSDEPIPDWLYEAEKKGLVLVKVDRYDQRSAYLYVKTPEGEMEVRRGCWIVNHDIFVEVMGDKAFYSTYEAVNDAED